MQKCETVFHYFLGTQMADRSQTSIGLSAYIHVSGGFHKVLTLPATVLQQNQFLNVPLNYQQLQCFVTEVVCMAFIFL